MPALRVTLFHGQHNDARLAGLDLVYGLGSYLPFPLPAGHGYIYCLAHNTGDTPLALTGLAGDVDGAGHTPELGLPAGVFPRDLAPGERVAWGFSAHLLAQRLRDHLAVDGRCPLRVSVYAAPPGGEPCAVASPALDVDCDCPRHPLEDMELLPYTDFFVRRADRIAAEHERIIREYGSLRDYANLHEHWGIHPGHDARGEPCWVAREYMPAAQRLWLTSEGLKFQRHARCAFKRDATASGWWEVRLPLDALRHGEYIELRVQDPAGGKALRRVPALARRVMQDADHPGQWCAQFWAPAPYPWRHPRPAPAAFPRIYEAHVGMAADAATRPHSESVGSFTAFAREVLPRVREAGYTAVQLMGVVEHPLYKSFGYQVSSFFAVTSRCGTPEDFKELVDTAHGLGLQVILDITHAHACPNTEQGLAGYDGSRFLFADKENQWGTLSFDFAQEMTRRLLLSNCRFWLEEFRVDGFRMDAVGNILYKDHGFADSFSHVGRCFYGKDGRPRANEEGELYLGLMNALVHELHPDNVSIAEEFSGMPGLTAAPARGGLGFDYRFAMGVPDFWGKFIKKSAPVGMIWHELTNHRTYDATVSYVECHDQCINGKDAMIWRLAGDAMYTAMYRGQQHGRVERALALYKLMRLLTLTCAHRGYLSFMGAEFGHPEWLDADVHAHRQWRLASDPDLKYSALAAFDKASLDLTVSHAMAFTHRPFVRLVHEEQRLLAFERGHLLVAANFHETSAHEAIRLRVTPGKYTEILSSDETCYAGYGNLATSQPAQEHFSDPTSGIDTQEIQIYLPPLTALVLVRS